MGELKKKGTSFGAVSIGSHAEGLRLRWTTNNKRKELYISSSQIQHEKIALKLKSLIEHDLLTGCYDETLTRYRSFLQHAAHLELVESRLGHRPATPVSELATTVQQSVSLDIVKEFNRYLTAKSLDPDSETLPSYYVQCRTMLKKWGLFDMRIRLFC